MSVRHLSLPLAVRPARRDLLRFLLTLFGVAVGVATITAIALANGSVLASFSASVDAVAGKASYTVSSDAGSVPEETLKRLAWLHAIGGAAVPAILDTALTKDTGDVVEVLGVDPLSEALVREHVVSQSKEPTDLSRLAQLLEPGTLVVTEPFARAHGLTVGSELVLIAGAREHALRVVAVVASRGAAESSSGSIVFTDLANAQELFGKVGRLDRIDVVLPEGLSTEARSRIEEEIRTSLPDGVSVGRPSRRTETVERLVRSFRVNLTALGLIALLVGAFFVYNTLLVSVLRRRTDIGTVRALGASARAVFGVFLLEGALLGVLGSALGLGLGILLAKAALFAIGGTATQLYVPMASPRLFLSPVTLALSFGTGVVASILSALAPALEAARVAPASSMRVGSLETVKRSSAPRFALFALALFASAAVAARQEPLAGLPIFGFLAVFCVVAGAGFLAPLAVTVAGRVPQRPLARIFGPEALIAQASLRGSLSRTSVAVAALTLALSMMVGIAVMVGSFRGTVVRWVGDTLRADLFVAPASGRSGASFGRLPDEAIALVSAVPGIAHVDPYLAISALRNGAPFTIGSGRFDVLAANGTLPFLDGRPARDVLLAARANGEAVVSEPYAVKFGAKTGDLVELPSPKGPQLLRIAGVYSDYSNDRGTVSIDRELFQELYGLTGASSLAIWLAPGTDPDAARTRILEAAKGLFALRVHTNVRLRQEVLRIFDRTFAVTWALQGVAIAVALLGVFNTLLALVLERRREIGLLRVLGTSVKGVKKAIRYEAAALGVLGSLLGLATGAALAHILIHVINRQSFGWTITTEWPAGFLAASFAGVLVATLLAAQRPATVAARTDPARALKEE